MRKIGIIIAREYNERVRKKSFIITTLIMPLFILGLMAAPTLIMTFGSSEQKQIMVIDQSGVVADKLTSNDEVKFLVKDDVSLESALQREDIFGVLYVGEDVMKNPKNVKLYTNSSSSMVLEQSISLQLKQIIESERIAAQNIENLDQIIRDIEAPVEVNTIRNDLSEEENEQTSSSSMSYMLGLILGMMLYMFILLYGTMVMTSVIEEKSSRVLDVLVSSVKPSQLLMGKILGVAAVAVTQVIIWGVLVITISYTVLPSLMPESTMQSVEAVQNGTMTAAETGIDNDLLSAMLMATDTTGLIVMFTYILLFLIGGFLFYAGLFAAIGSAVESIQDAQQLQTPVTVPIILSIILAMSVFNDPNSPIAFWGSMIPFTSPVVMMARIPFQIPMWEIVVSLMILYVSTLGAVWFAGKIYRIGVFMHGKKPSFKEILRWIRGN